jgi:hypothetical protein
LAVFKEIKGLAAAPADFAFFSSLAAQNCPMAKCAFGLLAASSAPNPRRASMSDYRDFRFSARFCRGGPL